MDPHIDHSSLLKHSTTEGHAVQVVAMEMVEVARAQHSGIVCK